MVWFCESMTLRAPHDEQQYRVEPGQDEHGARHDDEFGALDLVHQVVDVGVDLEHALHRLGRAGADRDVGLHQVVFFAGLVEAVEGVVEDQGVGDAAVDRRDEALVVALVGADLRGIGRGGDHAPLVENLDLDHRVVAHQPVDRCGELGGRCGVAGVADYGLFGCVQKIDQLRLHRMERGPRQRQIVALGRIHEPLDGDIPVQHGDQQRGGEDGQKARHRIEAQQCEHEVPFALRGCSGRRCAARGERTRPRYALIRGLAIPFLRVWHACAEPIYSVRCIVAG